MIYCIYLLCIMYRKGQIYRPCPSELGSEQCAESQGDLHLPPTPAWPPSIGSTSLAQALPGRKWVFTNSDRRHAETCLRLLGIEDCFDGLICFESVMAAAHLKGMAKDNAPVICKPSRKVSPAPSHSSQHHCRNLVSCGQSLCDSPGPALL